MKKKMVALAITAACILSIPVAGHAKSLKECFSGWSDYECVDINYGTGAQKYKKTTHAKTVGYQPKHYVLAYIGGSRESEVGSVSSKRVKGTGDITAACDHTAWVDSGLTPFYKWFFPTGYSKYGHCD